MFSSLKHRLSSHFQNSKLKTENFSFGFTLVELLIVVGILITISTAAVVVINPSELMKQSHDATRLSDLAALDKSLSLYRMDNTGVLANTSTVYLSLPDTSATCASYPTLPTLASPYVYHCATAATATLMDGTGWIPVNMSMLSQGTPLSHLPQDPLNTVSYYDAFISGSDGSYVLTTKLESQKYLTKATTDGGYDTARLENGAPVLWATATNLLDVTNPTVSTFSPADDATSASISADFTITFAEAVNVGTGNITLKKTNGTLIEAMDVTNPFRVSGSGSTTITINPTANLEYSNGYYVLIDATAFDDLAGNSYAGIADDATWNFTTGAQPWACGTDTVAYGGIDYPTVLIGTQCWFAQNLNVGTRIASTTNQTNNSTIEKYCYGNVTSGCDTANYGGFYQWDETVQYDGSCNGVCTNANCDGSGDHQACTTPKQGICPTGWHIPSHYEVMKMERAICTSGSCVTDFPYDETTMAWRGTNEATKLKEAGTTHWQSPNTNATNSAQFNALPSGVRDTDGSLVNRANGFIMWSSTAVDATYAWRRYMDSTQVTIYRGSGYKTYGASVRCVQN